MTADHRGAARRRFAVRRSPIHGRGVYALRDIAPGERLLEYRGEVISWTTATARYDDRPAGAESITYFFDRGDGTVIDGAVDGNSARFLNHGCEPNCEAVDVAGRIYLDALTAVRAGTELLLDYGLIIDDPDDPEVRSLYRCACGARTCRASMLAADPSA